MSILTVDNIVAGYGETEILHGVSMRVEPGEAVTLFGPERLRQVHSHENDLRPAGTPRQGSVVFEDSDITGMPTDRLIRHGHVLRPTDRQYLPLAHHRREP